MLLVINPNPLPDEFYETYLDKSRSLSFFRRIIISSGVIPTPSSSTQIFIKFTLLIFPILTKTKIFPSLENLIEFYNKLARIDCILFESWLIYLGTSPLIINFKSICFI